MLTATATASPVDLRCETSRQARPGVAACLSERQLAALHRAAGVVGGCTNTAGACLWLGAFFGLGRGEPFDVHDAVRCGSGVTEVCVLLRDWCVRCGEVLADWGGSEDTLHGGWTGVQCTAGKARSRRCCLPCQRRHKTAVDIAALSGAAALSACCCV